MHRPFALQSRRIVTPSGEREGAVLVREGAVAGIVPASAVPAGTWIEDCGSAAVLPGLVDTHVHVNEPGRTEWEGFATATRAAAAGGVTTILDMPLNSDPVTTTVRALEAKREAARGKLAVDAGLVGGVVPGCEDEALPLADAGVFAFKCFLIDSGIPEFPPAGEGLLRKVMPLLARRGLPLMVHAELAPAAAPPEFGPPRLYRSFLDSRPADWEDRAVDLVLELAAATGCRVHIVHLSSAGALDALGRARAAGVPVTVETCPHYLCFDAEQVRDGATLFKCCPPIRGPGNRERLWTALDRGEIDFVVSDHSPCSPELKRLEDGDFEKAWGGISSLQLSLRAIWTEASRRGHPLARVAEWMSARTAAFAGLKSKGAVAPGRDADLVVFDPDAEEPVRAAELLTRHRRTPYEGRRLRGKVLRTYLRGELIHEDGRPLGEPMGRLLAAQGVTA